MQTGYYAFETHDDGLRTFDTKTEAVISATNRVDEIHEQITVYTPDGDIVGTFGQQHPTHEQRYMDPEMYGFED